MKFPPEAPSPKKCAKTGETGFPFAKKRVLYGMDFILIFI